MHCVGTITFEPDPQPIDLAAWTKIVESHDLTPVATFKAVNPFTGDEDAIGPGGEAARVTAAGSTTGIIRWCPEGYGLDVFSEDADQILPFVEQLAAELGGEFAPFG